MASSSPDTPALPRDTAVAIIMDGNGRWATQRGVPVTEGHREGGKALRRAVEAALDLHVAELTVYAFSTENWRRSPDEVAGIMALFLELVQREAPDLNRQGVRMRFMGRREELDESLQQRMRWAEELTAGSDRLTLVIAFNYGGRAEIVDAARALARSGGPEAIEEDAISRALYLPELREPDIILRTAGEQRTSNFLVWQGAYSELVFTDTLWPDFCEATLREALLEYAQRERRFGGRAHAAANAVAKDAS